MKINKLAALVLAAAFLSGCGILKQKAAEYHLGKARKTASEQNPAPADIEAAFASVDKALGYAPGSEQAVALLEDLAAGAARVGFASAQELQAGSLKKALELGPLNWHAREALINFYASRGDTGGLEAMGAQAQELSSSADAAVKYCALLAALAARAAAVPWLESEGYLALNKSPEIFFEKTEAYAAAAARLPAMKAELEKLAASDPTVKKAAPAALVSAAEVAAGDALRSPDAVRRALDFVAKAGAEPAFRKAVEMTVQGNAALVKKEYSQARAFYQGALNHYPGLLDARRQLAEADFQEGAALAAAGGDPQAAARLLYKAYGGTGEVIAAALKSGNSLPFIKPEKFLGEAYSLKAADLAALRAVEGKRLRNTARLEAEFKAALDEAVKLNPEGRLARELLERYSREGF
ncbi:MAG: hypothetical protein A2X35_06440 [Elusimicrobia bacterium GWA2_61_42]|nr:MAG: hypothetical protein A2X35_06440 [Elusimicrobia bacterium GWA2_61_42]OGR78788.1 MAG: hypothetical protein A2X38_04385 [Elusimicrobia bacterium GWC2_61_25]